MQPAYRAVGQQYSCCSKARPAIPETKVIPRPLLRLCPVGLVWLPIPTTLLAIIGRQLMHWGLMSRAGLLPARYRPSVPGAGWGSRGMFALACCRHQQRLLPRTLLCCEGQSLSTSCAVLIINSAWVQVASNLMQSKECAMAGDVQSVCVKASRQEKGSVCAQVPVHCAGGLHSNLPQPAASSALRSR